MILTIGALSGSLEKEPLLGQEGLVRPHREAELVFGVVAGDQVQDDSAGLPEREVGVGIVDGGEAAIGVYGGELGLLDVLVRYGDDLVGKTKSLQDNDDPGRVGTADAAPQLDWLEIGSHRCVFDSGMSDRNRESA